MSDHKQPNYMLIFGLLALFTLIEVGVAFVPASKLLIVLALLALAIVKAVLVALYYMHLKFEGKLIYSIAIIPFVAAAVLTLAVLQDAHYF